MLVLRRISAFRRDTLTIFTDFPIVTRTKPRTCWDDDSEDQTHKKILTGFFLMFMVFLPRCMTIWYSSHDVWLHGICPTCIHTHIYIYIYIYACVFLFYVILLLFFYCSLFVSFCSSRFFQARLFNKRTHLYKTSSAAHVPLSSDTIL